MFTMSVLHVKRPHSIFSSTNRCMLYVYTYSYCDQNDILEYMISISDLEQSHVFILSISNLKMIAMGNAGGVGIGWGLS